MNSSFSGACLCIALLGAVATSATSCGSNSAERVSRTGTLRMALQGKSTSGATYRLRAAAFEITGTSQASISTEDDLTATSVGIELKAGEYLVQLEPGWYLERAASEGSFVQVKAALVSANPTTFDIVDQQTTMVRFRFSAGDEAVELGDGRVVIGIDVTDSLGDGGLDAGSPDGGGDAGLVFYCSFDSASAVTSLGGTVLGGAFEAGKQGNAFVSSGNGELLLPGELSPADRGAVEFWGRLTGYPAGEVVPWGNAPYFLGGDTAGYVGFNGNNGHSGGIAPGGLLGVRSAHSGTNCYSTSVTYGQILGDVTAWHHYALAWDTDGIPGTSYHIQLFLDGRRIGSPAVCGGNVDESVFPAASGTWLIPNNQHVRADRSSSIDELKIWNYARLDFSDSL